MSLPKDRYYWTQLRLALTSGQWSSRYPSKAPNGTALPWSELFRKFNKHCKGFQDVAEVASQTHALALLLGANSRDDDQDDEGVDVYPLELGRECMLPEERIEEARAGYDVLKGLKSSNLHTLNFALAYYAYALGNPAECLLHLSNIPDIVNLRNHIPSESDAATRSSAATGHTHHLEVHLPGFATASSLSSAGGSFASLAESSAPEIKDGRAWALTEALRGISLLGMSHEKLTPRDSRTALKAYSASLPLLSMLEAIFTEPASNPKVFTQERELWRWVERLLWRAIVVSARIANDGGGSENDIWIWLRQYSVFCTYWPATFRTAHRSTVSALYLRVCILRYHPKHAGPTSMTAQKAHAWLPAVLTIVNDYRAILSSCTSFPRAGERNIRVEDFVDLCVGIWEASGAGGEDAGWVIDILWWATRLTFNSHRVLRHMTRLLHASGDTALACRTLLLYVQVVGKAYEASRADAGSNNSSTWDLNNGNIDEEDEVESEADSDRSWVETLVAGARMLCRYSAAQPGLEGLKEAREAGTCIDKARTRLRVEGEEGTKLRAKMDLAEGIWNIIMTVKEQDPHSRPSRLASAHALLQRACAPPPTSQDQDSDSESSFVPEPAALYHLALSFAYPGPTHNLEQAILHAGRAIEGDAREVRYWHLLGLLLAAGEKWGEAMEILERGTAIGDDYTADGGEDYAVVIEDGSAEHTTTDTHTLRVSGQSRAEVREKDFSSKGKAANRGRGGSVSTEVTDNQTRDNDSISGGVPSGTSRRIPVLDGTRISSPAALLAPVQDHPPPLKSELFEQALQLRMTQGVLTEFIEGAEGAEEKWLEVFSWIAKQRVAEAATPRPPVNGTRPPTEQAPSFVISPPTAGNLSSLPEASVTNTGELDEKQDTLHLTPIPITISPATPDNEHSPHIRKQRRVNGERSSSMDRDTSKSKKVQQMLKNRVHKEQARITTISRKIGSGVVKTGSLKRSNSTPDFHAILRQTSYQASSIHSRRRVSSIVHHHSDRTPTESPPPLPTPVPPPPPQPEVKHDARTARSTRLIADLWLMSSATFRRLGKIEQAKGAIQEAEVRDEGNPGVWVQLGLYYIALNQKQHAMDALQKALFINPDDVSASVHLARLFLDLHEVGTEKAPTSPTSANVDLTAGMLSHLTRGNGWAVPEAWYYLAKAYGLQGRKSMERECLDFALALSDLRGIRELGTAIGWCI